MQIWEGGITEPQRDTRNAANECMGDARAGHIPVLLSCSLCVNNAWAAGAGPITGLRSGGIRSPLMVLMIRGRLPSGLWAAWAGSQDSGHLDLTGGRLWGWGEGGGKKTASLDQSSIQGILWAQQRPPAGGWWVCDKEQGPGPCRQVTKKVGSLRTRGRGEASQNLTSVALLSRVPTHIGDGALTTSQNDPQPVFKQV